MIRLIVSDLDGTLLSSHDTIHPDNLAAVQKALRRGIRFAVASGRGPAACSVLLRDAGLDEVPILGVNGAHVIDRPYGRMIALHAMAPEAAAQVAAIAERHGLDACFYNQDAIVYGTRDAYDRQTAVHQSDTFAARMAEAGCAYRIGQEALREALARPVLKAYCVFLPGQEDAFAKARAEAARIPGVALTSSWHDNFEVMPEGVDKGSAVRALAAQYGVAAQEVLAFGDSDNDLPMLRWAGHGYAMGNAAPEVKAEIDRHTAPCHEAGVARVIERYLAQP